MFVIIAHYQDEENYGTPEAPHWKFKGGESSVLCTITLEEIIQGLAHTRFQQHGRGPEVHNEMFKAYCIDWEIVDLEQDGVRFVGEHDVEGLVWVDGAEFEWLTGIRMMDGTYVQMLRPKLEMNPPRGWKG